jgi:hypothetical protein
LTLADKGSEDLRHLYNWLNGDDNLRGHMELVKTPPESGTLGGLFESIVTNLATGAAVAVFVNLFVVWIRERKGRLVLRMRRADGSELAIEMLLVKRMAVDQVQTLVQQLGAWVEGGRSPASLPEISATAPAEAPEPRPARGTWWRRRRAGGTP